MAILDLGQALVVSPVVELGLGLLAAALAGAALLAVGLRP
jgi:hypothetical protein